MTVERRFDYLFGSELQQRIDESPIAWVSMGPLERHGEHLQWGLDPLKAHSQNMLMAERFGGVVLPPISIAGIHRPFRPDPGEARLLQREVQDFYLREETFRMLVEDLIDGLDLIGFKIIVLNSGHFPTYQGVVAKEIAAKARPEYGARVIAFDEQDACGRIDHGGTYETSMMMVLGYETRLHNVRPEHADKLGHFSSATPPSAASREKGQAWLDKITGYFDQLIPPLLKEVRAEKR